MLMVKAQRFLFSFPKFMDYLTNNQYTLNLYSVTNSNSFSDETTFYLDDKLHISEEFIHGKGSTQWFLLDNNMVIAYRNELSPDVYIYYVINPDDEKDIRLVRNIKKPLVDETLRPIKHNIFKLMKEYGEINREDD